MESSAGFDYGCQQSTSADIDVLVNAALCARIGTYVFPLTETMCDNDKPHLSIGDSGITGSSLAGALLERPPQYRPRDPPQKRGPIYNMPIEILVRIFQLVAPPRIRESSYDLSKLTHVCRFWRMALINQPRVWSAIFITQEDRRSFVEMCVERSYPVALDVTLEASRIGWSHAGCTCDKGSQGRLMPNERNPCEWHFQFEPLAEIKHSHRIRSLDINFDGEWTPSAERVRLALGSCRFFISSFPRIVTLTWKNEETSHADYLFSSPPFGPPLRSLTYVGGWTGLIAQVQNLTSFVFDSDSRPWGTSTEAFRSFMRNNRSLESLYLKWIDFEGESKGPPVQLQNLRSFSVGLGSPIKKISTIILVPAFQRLSSLRISSEDAETYTLSATGDGISLTAECFLRDFAETWEDLTGYAKPVIHQVRLYDGPEFVDHCCRDNTTTVLLMMDAHTLEVGHNYLTGWYDSFWEDLKQLGPQLKTIRFEVQGDAEPCSDDGSLYDLDDDLWDNIEDLAKYRFDKGRPFSVMERLEVNESERENRLEGYVWRCFYGSRKISQYVQPV